MRRFPMIVLASIALLAALIGTLALLHIDRAPTIEAGSANMRMLWPWWGACAGLWLVLTLLWMKLRRSDAAETWKRQEVLLIIAVAVVARLVVLVTHDPALSDDIHRYTFDGRNFAAGVNPYLVTPQQRIDASPQRWPGERETAVLINNAELHTLYLPLSQYVFAGSALLISESFSGPNAAARVFRAVFLSVDALLILMLLAALRRAGRSPWWVALYAWHPLVITEIAGSGHQDVLGIALMVLALVLGAPDRLRAVRSWLWALPLALSVLVKPFGALAALYIVHPRRWRQWFAAGLLGCATVLAVAGPLLLVHDAQPLRKLSATAARFTATWAHFGSVYEPGLAILNAVDPIEDPETQWHRKQRHEAQARWVCITLILLVAGVVLAMRLDPWVGLRIVLLAMVLLSPTAHPWYLLWALALMPMAPSATLWILSLTLPWGYAVLGDTLTWHAAPRVYAAAYVPVYAALALEVWFALAARHRSKQRSKKHSDTTTTIAS